MAVFNCSNLADREKDKPNYSSPSIIKNNGKEGLKLSKVRREKWLAQIFKKDITERNLEQTRMKIMPSSSPSSVFSHKVYNIRYANTYSILTVIELGPLVSESSTKTSKFYDPTDSEHKLDKTRIENWLSIGFELEFL